MRHSLSCHKILFIFSFLILSITSAKAQTKLDSLRKLTKELTGNEKIDQQYILAKELLTIDPDEAEILIESALKDSEILGYSEGKVLMWLAKASLYNYRTQLFDSEKFLNKAIVLAEEIGFEKGLAQGELTMGNLFFRKRELSKALRHFIKGLDAARKSKNTRFQVSNLINMGVVNQLLEEYDEAEKYLKEALALCTENGLEMRKGQVNGNLGIIEFKRQNFGRSIEYHQAGLVIFQRLNHKFQSAMSLFNLGLAYMELNELSKAMDYYDQSIVLRKEMKDKLGTSIVLRYKGKTLAQQGKQDEAITLFTESASIAAEFKDYLHMRDTYQLMYEMYEQEGDLINAYKHYKAYVNAKDSLNASTNQDEINTLTAQFEFEQLEKQNELILNESKIQELKVVQRNQAIVGIIAISFLLVVLLTWNREKLKGLLAIKEKDSKIAQQEIEIRAKEFEAEKVRLVEYANQLLSKNEALEEKKKELEEQIALSEDDNTEVDKLVEKMYTAVHNQKDWAAFVLYFESIFPEFFLNLKKAIRIELTQSEQRLIALLKINLSNKEIGGILNISRDSVVKAKYRLKQKFGFKESGEMDSFLAKIG